MKKLFVILWASLFLSMATPALAVVSSCATTDGKPGEYCLLEPLPYVQTVDGRTNISAYIPNAVKLIIGLATATAVVMLVIGGLEYISAATIGGKSDGRDRIRNALIGLVLAIGSWTLLHTLNPNLVNFSLYIEPVGTSTPLDLTLASTTPGKANCTNCVDVANYSFPRKTVAENGCASPGPCMVDPAMGSRLQALDAKLTGKVTWQVTEMIPPTVVHKDSCHQDGSCVDAKLLAVTTGRLITFLTEVESVFGQRYEYEACGARLATLQNDPQLAKFKSHFKCESTTVGDESIHLEL